VSVEALAVVLHHSKAKGTHKLVLLGIANHAGDGGAWPTIETLAHYANVEPRSVQKALQRLVSMGEVRIHRQAGGTYDMDDYRRPNRFDVLVECPPSCDRSMQHRDDRRRKRGGQSALWINPLSAGTPGELADTPPLSPASPKPELQPSMNSGSVALPKQQTARELHPCKSCGQPKAHPWHSGDDHPYTPVWHPTTVVEAMSDD
jgi:hypothetical protein